MSNEFEQITFEDINYPKLAFITEGNLKMGLGHVYRSLMLANILKKELEVQIYFLTRSDKIVVKKIQDEGFPVIQFDDNEVVDILKKTDTNLIIIDGMDLNFGYDILKTFKNDLNSNIARVNNSNPEYDKYFDIIINSTLRSNFENNSYFDENIGTKYFYGPKYLIFRDEFNKFKNMHRNLKPKIENILIIFGGSDPSDLTSKVLEELKGNDEINLDVVIGPKFKSRIKDEISNEYVGANITFHQEPDNIAELMFNADVVITHPGISMFEAMYIGTPVISIYQNTTQKYWYTTFNYEFLLDKSDIKRLNHYINFISPIEKRNEIINDFRKMEIGEGKDELVSTLSETIKNN